MASAMSNLDVIATERARTLIRAVAESQHERGARPFTDRVDADALPLSHTRTAERIEQLLAVADRVWSDADRLEQLRASAAVDAETEACNAWGVSRVH
jgi:hypothetical protein